MIRTLALALAAVTLVGVTLPEAHAKSCDLIKDAAGDVNNSPGFPVDDSLDLVLGDFASSAKSVTTVIRLSSDVPGAHPLYDRRWVLQFKPSGSANTLLLAARQVALTGEQVFNFGFISTSATGTTYNYPGAATGSIAGKEVKITATLAEMAANTDMGSVKPGVKVSGFVVESFRRVNLVARGHLFGADEATSSKSYVAASASCIKV